MEMINIINPNIIHNYLSIYYIIMYIRIIYSKCEWDIAISQSYNIKINSSLTAKNNLQNPIKFLDNKTLSTMRIRLKFLVFILLY